MGKRTLAPDFFSQTMLKIQIFVINSCKSFHRNLIHIYFDQLLLAVTCFSDHIRLVLLLELLRVFVFSLGNLSKSFSLDRLHWPTSG